jgi:hypothetical protein
MLVHGKDRKGSVCRNPSPNLGVKGSGGREHNQLVGVGVVVVGVDVGLFIIFIKPIENEVSLNDTYALFSLGLSLRFIL